MHGRLVCTLNTVPLTFDGLNALYVTPQLQRSFLMDFIHSITENDDIPCPNVMT